MSRQNFSPHPSEPSPQQGESPVERQSDSPAVSSASPQHHAPPRESESSEGYPSWLPKRPPHPAPASTMQSSVGLFPEQPMEPFIVGRKPTPRSVRIVSVPGSEGAERDGVLREPIDQTRVGQPLHSRVWSRATTAGVSPTVFSARFGQPQVPPPRFKTNGLHLELLRNPSIISRLHYYLLPIIAFYHIPLQTFFDFNAVFILIQVAKYPNPVAPGVPGSGKNWALGAAAYVACWLTWIVVVFIIYELVYSFYRRWRVKRPLILPIYMSSSAFNLASMTSFDTFSYLRHVRMAAFHPEQGGTLRDGLSETCWFYSQNTATVALLLPRAGLCLALLLTFSSAQPGALALAASGRVMRDRTFFRPESGTLTDYAQGVLIANAAWAAWRILVFLTSWFGLWILSGHGCAGLCGPRFRWQEEDAEKTASVYDDNGEIDLDALPWSWKESTRFRIQDAYEFCLPKHSKRGSKREMSGIEEPKVPAPGMEHIFAAVGLPSGPQPARRGLLSDRLFETPPPDAEPFVEISEKVHTKSPLDFSSVIPPVREKETRDVGPAGPLKDLPYPFIGHRGAQVSSEEQVPFPPSPRNSNSNESDEEEDDEDKENIHIDVESETHDGEDMEGLDVEEDEEDPSDERRTSGSLSSLGQPVPSRYPFQYRRPRGGSSLSSRSHMTPQSINTHSTRTGSTPSRSTQSTGNVESSDSPWSNLSSISPRSQESNGIPMPPRHPQAQQRRARAGTVPASPTPMYPSRRRPRTRTSSGSTSASRAEPSPVYESSGEEEEEQRMEQPEAEGPHEEAEREDSVGLLSAAPSPRTSLMHRPSNISRHRYGSGSSSSKSHSQGRSPATSLHSGPRSRTQSLIHSLNAASRSSLDLVRSRANSMARLSDSPWYSQSDASPSSPENNTFGQPLRSDWRTPSNLNLVEEQTGHGDTLSDSGSVLDPSIPELRVFPSSPPSVLESEDGTIIRDLTATQTLPVQIPGRNLAVGESQPDISTAAQSFITAAATIHGSTTTGSDDVVGTGTTPPGWGTGQGYGGHFDSSMRPV